MAKIQNNGFPTHRQVQDMRVGKAGYTVSAHGLDDVILLASNCTRMVAQNCRLLSGKTGS